MHHEALGNWIRQAETAAGERHDRPTTEVAEENRRLREEVAELRRVNDPACGVQLFASELGPAPATVMRFIDEHRDRFAVALLLRVLNIAESTYGCREQAEQPSDRDLVDLGLLSNIQIWETSGHTYGADRVHRQLRRDGIWVGRKRVERLMAGQGWHGVFLRRGWCGGSTKQDPRHTPASDLANRNFTAGAPNRLWVADATLIPCGEGVFWLAAVRDVFSRRIVGVEDLGPVRHGSDLGRAEVRHLRATSMTGS